MISIVSKRHYGMPATVLVLSDLMGSWDALVAFVAAQSEALVVWLSLPAPFFAALAPVGEWNTHFELFLSRIQLHRPASSNLFGAASNGFI